MKVAILGFGQQGRSAYGYYRALGHQVTICDQLDKLANAPKGADLRLGPTYLENLRAFDLLVRTPFLQPDKIVAANSNDSHILDRVTTASNEFFQQVQTPIIAITGTKGKGTTSLLCQAILESAGLKVCLVGNVGIPPLDVVEAANKSDVVVFEIASFQTMDLTYSPQVGVCLNMSPEHLDWHKDYEDYLNCKAQLFANQDPKDKAIFAFGDKDSERIVRNGRGQILSYGGNDFESHACITDESIYVAGKKVAEISDIKLLGRHNQQNVCAAIAACYDFLPAALAGQIIARALSVCKSFPSRLEPIRELRQVTYINDSYASAPEASIAALKAVEAPKILIAGGHDKGVDMSRFVEKILASNVKHLITIGDTGVKIARLVKMQNPDFSLSENCHSMQEIVNDAASHAVAGDVVLLSAGSASFGMFKNYDDRANQFKQAVTELQ